MVFRLGREKRGVEEEEMVFQRMEIRTKPFAEVNEEKVRAMKTPLEVITGSGVGEFETGLIFSQNLVI